jgi:5-methylcytosine-specific restriction endonuclease McrA
MNKLIKEFIETEKIRVGKLYSKKHKQGFLTKSSFTEWFINQFKKQNYKCFYCETSIFDIRQLIVDKKLLPRKIGFGFRGPKLEVEKMINEIGYKPENCVLSCYYCNNDKSSIFDSTVYKSYFGKNRCVFFKSLMLIDEEIKKKTSP